MRRRGGGEQQFFYPRDRRKCRGAGRPFQSGRTCQGDSRPARRCESPPAAIRGRQGARQPLYVGRVRSEAKGALRCIVVVVPLFTSSGECMLVVDQPSAENTKGEVRPLMPSAPVRTGPRSAERAVVVHAGARDAYQVALALSEHGMLEALVTDLFWADETDKRLGRFLPAKVRKLLRQRSVSGLSARSLRLHALGGLWSLALEKSAWA